MVNKAKIDALLRSIAELRKPGDRFCPHQPTPKQAEFLALDCIEALYGGAAGGGKSDALLMAALKYVHVPGYAAILFRRTYTDLALAGALMDRARQWLAPTKARWVEREKKWLFPSGATLSFGYLENMHDHERYQSSEYQFCVAGGTPILMASGFWKSIEKIQVGEYVATLLGPRPVTRVHRPGTKKVERLTSSYGACLVSESHRLLTAFGWASPLELRSILSRENGNNDAASMPTSEAACMLAALTSQDRLLIGAREQLYQQQSHVRGCDVLSANDQIGCAVFGDEHREDSLPQALCFRAKLFEPAVRLLDSARAVGSRRRAHHRERTATSIQGSASGCRGECDFCDERARLLAAGAQGSIRQLGDAVEQRQFCCFGDGQENIQARIQTDPRQLHHPYTMQPLAAVEASHLACVSMVRAGEAEVFDLTVAEASHYVTWGGFISQNCAFDEVTQFAERQYTYLFSRLRRANGVDVPLRMRSATNPGGPGHAWVKARFDPEHPEARPGGRVFVPARLADNAHVDQGAYLESLSKLDTITRAQLEDGRWIVDTSGKVYRITERNVIDELPTLPGNEQWTHVLGVDYGNVDATALSVLAFTRHSPNVYVRKSRAWTKLTPSDAADIVKSWDDKYHFEAMVADVGGLGKGYAEEAKKRWALPLQAAQKNDKQGYIKMINGDLEKGRLLIAKRHNEELITEMGELLRDAKGFEHPLMPNHLCDATLYAWRKCRGWLWEERKTEPEPGSQAFYDALEADIEWEDEPEDVAS